MTPREIAFMRLALELTQTEFASVIGVHVMTISKWERGISAPSAWQHGIMQRFNGAAYRRESMKEKLASWGPVTVLAYLLAKSL